MNSSPRKIIPIIGIISSGKSTFLQGLINSDVLESGGSTTTKFFCLIKHKNIDNFQFYHVKLINEKNIFIKDGEVIYGEENIKVKIKEINKDNQINENNLFYVLECPINCIKNKDILEENYFMDCPGLNEAKSNYFKNIFQNIKDIINFYIFIFNIDHYVGDEVKDIFENLEKNGCLQKKEGNLFLLNKIDNIKAGSIDSRIEDFSNYFYNTFEKNSLKINKYKNTFIPISSISYKAEVSLEKFSSFLIFHFIKISMETNEEDFSFIEKLKNAVDNILENDEDLELEIKKLTKKISPEEKKLIAGEIGKFDSIKNYICYSVEINSDINMKKREHYDTIYKLFYLSKKGKFPIQNSDAYKKLNEFFNNKNSILSEEEISLSNDKNNNIKLLEKLTNFVSDSISSETFKDVGEEAFNIFRNEFQAIKNNLLSEKLRIALIGSISVGKSSILNCLIGEEINPTKSDECTYRGVIYRYRDCEDFKLYKTELKSIGEGIYEYLYFNDDSEPYCKGLRNIKDLLNNKNKDKKLTKEDSFIVITGKLRVFDLLNFSDDLKNKIELIDLPGFNNSNNQFIEKPKNTKKYSYYDNLSYYEKILCFTNVCIFVNMPENMDDEKNKNKIKEQYIFNKRLLHQKVQHKFNESCLFIINQIDLLDKETPEEDLKIKYRNIIKELNENADNLYITCFSSLYYLKYLSFEKLFKDNTNENIEKIWNFFYDKYQNSFFKIFRRFGNIMMNIIEKYENYFKIKFDENILEINNQYKDKIIEMYSKMEKLPSLDDEEQNEIASHLYNFYIKLNNSEYTFFNVRKEIFDYFEKIINNANETISKNYIFSLHNFFEGLDPLFEDENEEIKKVDKKNIEIYIKTVQEISIPKVEEILENKRKSIIKIFDIVEQKIKNIIEKEKENIKEGIKKNEEELKNEFVNFQQKISFKIKEMENQVNEEFNNLGIEIKEYYDETLKKVNTGLIKYKNLLNSINTNIYTSLFKGYILTGIRVLGVGVCVWGFGAYVPLLLAGTISWPIGFGSLAFFFLSGLCINKGYKDLSQIYFDKYDNYQKNIENNILDSKEKILKQFDDRKKIILKQLILSLKGIELRMHASNDKTFKKKCEEFKRLKNELKERLPKE